jgi:hypothetical protein
MILGRLFGNGIEELLLCAVVLLVDEFKLGELVLFKNVFCDD